VRRAFLLLVFALVAGGCNGGRRTPASAYRHLGDRIKAMGGGWFGWPCVQSSKREPGTLESSPRRECYRFDKPSRMTGIWIAEFEGSHFFPNGSVMPAADHYRDKIWLDDEPDGSVLPLARDANGPGKIYAIDFIGERTSDAGAYGHMGGSTYLILADRIISIREVRRPWPGSVVDIHQSGGVR
jgi:hypothetical protein